MQSLVRGGLRFWKGCKPNFVFPDKSGERIICLSSQYPGPVPLSRNVERATPRSPIWPCTRWGLPCLVACASSGGLLLHLFTLTEVLANRGGIFSVALSVGTPHGITSRVYLSNASVRKLRGIAPYGVRTFLPRLAPEAILRLSKTAGIIPDRVG